jgi:hypothetical protein
MNSKKIIILFLILITLMTMGAIFLSKPNRVVEIFQPSVRPNTSDQPIKFVEPEKLIVDEENLPNKNELLLAQIKQFRHALPKIKDIKSKKIDTHRPGIILYEMVDQLGELEEFVREKAKLNDFKGVEQIVAIYAECAKDKQFYLPARALCLERIQSHSQQYKLPYNPKDFPVDVRSLLSTPDKL